MGTVPRLIDPHNGLMNRVQELVVVVVMVVGHYCWHHLIHPLLVAVVAVAVVVVGGTVLNNQPYINDLVDIDWWQMEIALLVQLCDR